MTKGRVSLVDLLALSGRSIEFFASGIEVTLSAMIDFAEGNMSALDDRSQRHLSFLLGVDGPPVGKLSYRSVGVDMSASVPTWRVTRANIDVFERAHAQLLKGIPFLKVMPRQYYGTSRLVFVDFRNQVSVRSLFVAVSSAVRKEVCALLSSGGNTHVGDVGPEGFKEYAGAYPNVSDPIVWNAIELHQYAQDARVKSAAETGEAWTPARLVAAG